MGVYKSIIKCVTLKYGGVVRTESPLMHPSNHRRGRVTGRLKSDASHGWTSSKLREATKMVYGFEGEFKWMITVVMDLKLDGEIYAGAVKKLGRKLSALCTQAGDNNVHIGLLEGNKRQLPHYHILTDLDLDQNAIENLTKLCKKWGFCSPKFSEVFDDEGVRKYVVKDRSWKNQQVVKPRKLPIKWEDSKLKLRFNSANFRSRLLKKSVYVNTQDLLLKSARQPYYQIQFGVTFEEVKMRELSSVWQEAPRNCYNLKDLKLSTIPSDLGSLCKEGVPAQGRSP